MIHQAAFFLALVVGTLLVIYADGTRETVGAVAFAAAVVAMLGASALYHRVTWSPGTRLWMRRVDHAGIYLLIAGTYTPVGLISLHGPLRTTVLAIVWSGAGAATLAKFCWVRAPKWLSAVIGVALGWVGVAAMPQLAQHEGLVPVVLLAAGGVAYTLGAVVYALRRPDPVPTVFGYHEVFHAFTLVALASQYVAVAFFVVRVG